MTCLKKLCLFASATTIPRSDAFETPGGRIFAVQARTAGEILDIGRQSALVGGRRLLADVRIAGMNCFAKDGKRVLVPVGVRSEKDFGTQLTGDELAIGARREIGILGGIYRLRGRTGVSDGSSEIGASAASGGVIFLSTPSSSL